MNKITKWGVHTYTNTSDCVEDDDRQSAPGDPLREAGGQHGTHTPDSGART